VKIRSINTLNFTWATVSARQPLSSNSNIAKRQNKTNKTKIKPTKALRSQAIELKLILVMGSDNNGFQAFSL
jgi:hypothetical protein